MGSDGNENGKMRTMEMKMARTMEKMTPMKSQIMMMMIPHQQMRMAKTLEETIAPKALT